jgi:hypothetical protein
MSFRGDDRGRIRGEMRALTSGELLSLPVLLHGITVGHPVDLLLDTTSLRALGLEVRCGDGAHRFLAFPAARVGEDEIAIDSGLTLVDDVAFYRSRGTALAALRGGPVERGGRGLVTIEPELLEPAIAALAGLVESGRVRRLAPERVDGEPIGGTRAEELLLEHGFLQGHRRLVLRG